MPKATKSAIGHRHLVLYSLSAVLLAVILSQIMVQGALNLRLGRLETVELKSALVNAATNLNQPLAVDPTTGRQYIPSLKLVLPAPDAGLRVGFLGAIEGQPLQFNDVSNVNQAVAELQNSGNVSETFDHVKGLQACTHQVTVSFNQTQAQAEADTGRQLTQLSTKTLRDGRNMVIYKTDGCKGQSDSLVKYLEQMQSF